MKSIPGWFLKHVRAPVPHSPKMDPAPEFVTHAPPEASPLPPSHRKCRRCQGCAFCIPHNDCPRCLADRRKRENCGNCGRPYPPVNKKITQGVPPAPKEI